MNDKNPTHTLGFFGLCCDIVVLLKEACQIPAFAFLLLFHLLADPAGLSVMVKETICDGKHFCAKERRLAIWRYGRRIGPYTVILILKRCVAECHGSIANCGVGNECQM